MNDSRRHFLQQSLILTSSCAMPQAVVALGISKDNPQVQAERKARAKYIMVFASPYASENWQYSPHMHQQLKANIENFSKGQIYVDIQDKGRAGVGTDLMAQVTRGHVAAALISVSNLVPAAPELDILNIPFWAAEKQSYLNLVTSNIWKHLIVDKIQAKGQLEILFPYLVGSRTISSVKPLQKAFTLPKDLNDVVFRVPVSPVLKEFYELLGARVVSVPWKDVAQFSGNGLIQAVDSSIVGLFNGPDNLKNHIGAIFEVGSVHDGWMAVVSQKWQNTLPGSLKEALSEAAKLTFKQHLQSVSVINKNCQRAFASLGVQTIQPSPEQQAEWVARAGHQLEKWSSVKAQLLGNALEFERLLEASKSTSEYRIG